jgi:hypothetical protein
LGEIWPFQSGDETGIRDVDDVQCRANADIGADAENYIEAVAGGIDEYVADTVG